MDDPTSLDDILSDEPNEALDTPVVENEPDIARDEHGRFAKGVEEPQETVAESVPPADKLPREEFAGLKDERRKRQEAEDRARTLEAQLLAYQQPAAEPPSIWDDEAAARQYDRDTSVSQAVQQATFNARLDMSEMMVRQANPDFEDVKAEFLALAEANPAIAQQALADPHPWAKAYQIAKNHKAMLDLGATDMDTMRAKIREELLAEMQQAVPVTRGLPPSLGSERNVGQRTGPAWSGPASLEDMLR